MTVTGSSPTVLSKYCPRDERQRENTQNRRSYIDSIKTFCIQPSVTRGDDGTTGLGPRLDSKTGVEV